VGCHLNLVLSLATKLRLRAGGAGQTPNQPAITQPTTITSSRRETGDFEARKSIVFINENRSRI